MFSTQRWSRARWSILILVILNGALGLTSAVWVQARQPSIAAHFEEGFPSDMLVLHNRTNKKDVLLILDERFRLRVEKLSSGVHGFGIQRLFRDRHASHPEWGFEPTMLRIVYGRGEETIKVLRSEASP